MQNPNNYTILLNAFQVKLFMQISLAKLLQKSKNMLRRAIMDGWAKGFRM
jgi:hypothetical protein